MIRRDALNILGPNERKFSMGLRLRAHAVLFADGATPEHADWCNEAADYIETIEQMLHTRKDSSP